jgi:D-proline reductase (dithiol) PrdB
MPGRQPPVRYIDRTRQQYDALGYGTYAWVHETDPPPFTPLRKPIAENRLGVVASGGVYARGQTAFTFRDDTTYRAIATDVDTAELRATHFAYDLTDARRDVNCVFPLDTARGLVRDGEIGSLAPHWFTCMGGIYSARRVREELAPALVDRCLADGVEVLLLVPV